MTLLQLKYVITVTSSQTIRKAAEELYITQPSLTASIKRKRMELTVFISIL
ncbi:MAG: LysR family transcriptional regulator [Lachnospirales bacterium]